MSSFPPLHSLISQSHHPLVFFILYFHIPPGFLSPNLKLSRLYSFFSTYQTTSHNAALDYKSFTLLEPSLSSLVILFFTSLRPPSLLITSLLHSLPFSFMIYLYHSRSACFFFSNLAHFTFNLLPTVIKHNDVAAFHFHGTH